MPKTSSAGPNCYLEEKARKLRFRNIYETYVCYNALIK